MRCFLAIELPEGIKKELSRIQKEIPEFKGNLVSKENMHLTLKFFGEIDDKKLNEIKKELSEIKFNSFKANLGKIGSFPSESFIRVLWVSLEPADKVKELNAEINKILESHDREFESHITLARIKFIKEKEAFIKKIKGIKFKTRDFEIKSFVLKKSTLTEKGPIYETIKEFRLQ